MDTLALQAAFADMQVAVRDSLNEDDIERLFQPVYVALGYLSVGQDILGKRKGKSGIPDVELRNNDDSTQVVFELKKPSEALGDHENQLIRYVRELKAPYGILSNGKSVWVYERSGLTVDQTAQYSVSDLATEASTLEPLRKRILEPTDFKQVKARLEAAKEEGLVLVDIGSLQSKQFLSAFALETGRPFGDLVKATQAMLDDLLETSDFAKGAYDFWKKTYARELSSKDVPNIWKPFLEKTNKESIYRFTYALETTYLLAARLILAKAIQDHDREGRISSKHIAERFISDLDSQADDRTGRLKPTAYLDVAQTLFNRYATSLFTSVYAQDLFDWWRDYPKGDETNQNTFALALGRLVLSLVRFDFSQLEGDLLGELYQSYFDPETRKALGEFYTPPEVVEFILDEVGYEGEGRLLDPATGSGTFLIAALRRYLRANEGRDAGETLKGLAREFNLVAFDVNPFAVMMAQVNVAAQLVPLYAKAVEEDSSFTLRRLPVVRTDSLRQEVIEGERRQKGAQVGLDFGEETIRATIPLPVKVGSRFLEVTLEFPRLETARNAGLIRNEREWLLALQSVFIAVEERSQAFDKNAPLPEIAPSLRRELALYWREPDALTKYLEPYAEKVWEVLETLKTKHGDGRFLKTLEDLMLGLVLKHYLEYDYVVGNPPYVRIQNIPEVLKQYWDGKYAWASGKYDIFIPFIERVLYGERPWLKDGGKLGYIVPNRFMNTRYAEKLRETLPRVARIHSVTDFKAVTFKPENEDQAARLFREAMVYPAILIAERSLPPKESYTFKAARFYPSQARVHPARAIETLQTSYRKLKNNDYLELETKQGAYADVFEQSSDALLARGWYFMPEHERKVFGKLDEIGESQDAALKVPGKKTDGKRRLYNYTATDSGGFYGFITGLDSVLVVQAVPKRVEDDTLMYVTSKETQTPFLIEKKIVRPFVFGRDVSSWYIDWKNYYVIFPYAKNEHGLYQLFRSKPYEEEFKYELPFIEDYAPKAWDYLNKYEAKLRKRVGGKFKEKTSRKHRWYELVQTSYIDMTGHQRALLQILSQRFSVAIDPNPYVFQAGGKGGGLYGIMPNNAAPSLSAFVGLMNSNTLDFYLCQTSSVYSGGYYSYGDQFIKDLPIPETTPAQQKAVASFAQTLTEKTARLRELETWLESFPASVTSQRRAAGRVPDLDDLSRLVRASNLAKTVDADKVSEQDTLQGETVLSVGNGELRAKPALAKLVRRTLELRGKIDRDDLLALEVPMNASDQSAYLDTLAAWQGEITELRDEIVGHETELNDAVYEVYGLDEKDREVVEGFLERF